MTNSERDILTYKVYAVPLLVETVTDNRQTQKTAGSVRPRQLAFHMNAMLYLCNKFT